MDHKYAESLKSSRVQPSHQVVVNRGWKRLTEGVCVKRWSSDALELWGSFLKTAAPHPWFFRVFPPVWTSLYTSFWEIQRQTPSHSWGSLTSRTKQWFQTFGWPPALTTACAHQPFFLGDDIKVEFPWKFSDPEKGYRWPAHSIIVFGR